MRDFAPWRQALTEAGLSPAAFNRTNAGLRAALNLAASQDESIVNARAWQTGLTNIPNAGRARNVVLTEQQVRAVVGAAYQQGQAFGLLVETLAVTGTRVSQAARLEVRDLQADRTTALLMPASRKGGGSKQIEHRPVPIPPGLVAKLKAQAAGRPAEALLLLKHDGTPWQKSNHGDGFTEAVKAVGLDPRVVTIYSLRHTSITRQLLSGVPIRLCASLHDTSVKMIEQLTAGTFLITPTRSHGMRCLISTRRPPLTSYRCRCGHDGRRQAAALCQADGRDSARLKASLRNSGDARITAVAATREGS